MIASEYHQEKENRLLQPRDKKTKICQVKVHHQRKNRRKTQHGPPTELMA